MRNPGGTNLVVFNQLLDGSDRRRVDAYDPEGRLPQSGASWPP